MYEDKEIERLEKKKHFGYGFVGFSLGAAAVSLSAIVYSMGDFNNSYNLLSDHSRLKIKEAKLEKLTSEKKNLFDGLGIGSPIASDAEVYNLQLTRDSLWDLEHSDAYEAAYETNENTKDDFFLFSLLSFMAPLIFFIGSSFYIDKQERLIKNLKKEKSPEKVE